MSGKPMSFRFTGQIADFLKTTAFITNRDQKEILEEAFTNWLENQRELYKKVVQISEMVE